MTGAWLALLGGAMIGASASWTLWSLGRIAGISGIVGGWLQGRREPWRLAFILGLLLAGFGLAWFAPEAVAPSSQRSLAAVLVGGLFVGFGVRMGNGCTSGHGVCGLSAGSARSGVATAVFMITGMATATMAQWWWGGL